MAHLPGIEKLLRCMLVREPARRATLADISRRRAFHSSFYQLCINALIPLCPVRDLVCLQVEAPSLHHVCLQRGRDKL